MHIGPIFRALLRNGSRSGVAVAMTALTLAIVVNCTQMILGAREKMAQSSGFDDANLVALYSEPYGEEFQEPEYEAQIRRRDMQLLRARTEVVSVTATHLLPWRGGGSSWECRAEGSQAGFQRMQSYPAGPHIQETLGVEIVAGRALTQEETDDPDSDAVLISKALAELLFPDGSAVGKLLETPDPSNRPRVVGVLDRFYNPYAWPIERYVMFWAGYRSETPFLVRLRASEAPDAGTRVSFLEELLTSSTAGRNVTSRTVPETRRRFFSQSQALIEVLGLIIVLMIGVTSIGIFGMTYFAVAQRTRQIGTRRALGARRLDILKYFLTENWIITSVGLTLGLGLSFALNLALVHQAGAQRLHWGLLGLGVVLLWSVSLTAALVPALRGAHVAPAIATRAV